MDLLFTLVFVLCLPSVYWAQDPARLDFSKRFSNMIPPLRKLQSESILRGKIHEPSFISSDGPNAESLNDDRSHVVFYTYNLLGRYGIIASPANATHSLNNSKEENILDEGILEAFLYTRKSSLRSIHMAFLDVSLRSKTNPQVKTTLLMSGLDIKDVSVLTFQGSTSPRSLHMPALMDYIQASTVHRDSSCQLVASLNFRRYTYDRPYFPSLLNDDNHVDWKFEHFLDREGSRRQLASMLDEEMLLTSHVPQTSPEDETSYQFKGVIASSSCGFRIVVMANELDLVGLGTRVLHLLVIFVFKTLLETFFFIAQIRYTDSISAGLTKISLIGLEIQLSIDCFEATLMLFQVLSANFMTSTFLVMAIFKILLISVLELRYMFDIARAVYADQMDNDHFAKLLKINAVVTFSILFIVMKLLPYFPLLGLLLYSFWIPQICLNVYKGHRKPFSLRFIIGMSICRSFIPLYLWGCPKQIFQTMIFSSITGPPNQKVALLIVGSIALQAAVFCAQHHFGPRCFVPLIFLPNVYNYYQPVSPDLEMKKRGYGYECVICMSEISYISKKMVVTPCQHHFHETCLHQWIDIKAECPTCRQPLPPFPE